MAILLPVLLLLGALGWWLWNGSRPAEPPLPGAIGGESALEAGEGSFPAAADTMEDPGRAEAANPLERVEQEGPSAVVLPGDAGSGAIQVQVVDEQGIPFAGVSFAVWKRDSSAMGGRTRPPLADEPIATGVADEEGRFEVPGGILPEALGRIAVQMGFLDLELMLRHPELADARPGSHLPSEGVWIVRLPRTTSTSSGQILTPDGKPAAMAELHVNDTLMGWASPEGKFRLKRPEQGSAAHLRVLHPEGSLDLLLDRKDHGVVRLQRGMSISGTVVDARGIGVEKVHLHLARRVEPGDDIGNFHSVGVITTADGSFAFRGLPPGMYSISAFMGEANGPLPLNIPLQQHGERVLALRAGDLGVRLEMSAKVVYLNLKWPQEDPPRPRWVTTGLVAPLDTNPLVHSRFRLPPKQVYMVWPGEVPAAGLDLEWRVSAEGYAPLQMPVTLTQEIQILRLEATMQRLEDVGSLRVDLVLPSAARGWQLDYDLEPLEGQELPEKYLRLTLPDLEGKRQSNLLLDLPSGAYRLVLGETGQAAFGPPAMRIVGKDTVRVIAGQLQLGQFTLEMVNPAPLVPSGH